MTGTSFGGGPGRQDSFGGRMTSRIGQQVAKTIPHNSRVMTRIEVSFELRDLRLEIGDDMFKTVLV